jgi:MinD superfamily P-loop ATPase
VVESGVARDIAFSQGRLNVGEAMAVPILRHLRRIVDDVPADLVILDAPPGTSCPVVETLRHSDYALLVTEPTPFGLHDLRIAVEVARGQLGLPVGVVVNRDGSGDHGVDAFCLEEQIPILMCIPLDRRIAVAGSDGHSLLAALPEYRDRFISLGERIREEVRRCVRS